MKAKSENVLKNDFAVFLKDAPFGDSLGRTEDCSRLKKMTEMSTSGIARSELGFPSGKIKY